jgi:hypothetical protein
MHGLDLQLVTKLKYQHYVHYNNALKIVYKY